MPGEQTLLARSFDVATDLTTYSNRLVKLSAGKTVTVCGANEKAIGLLQNAKDCGAAGKPASVLIFGIGLVTVNANSPNIAAGDFIESGANGVGVQSATDKHNAIGIALEAAAADGVQIEVLFTGPFTTSL